MYFLPTMNAKESEEQAGLNILRWAVLELCGVSHPRAASNYLEAAAIGDANHSYGDALQKSVPSIRALYCLESRKNAACRQDHSAIIAQHVLQEISRAQICCSWSAALPQASESALLAQAGSSPLHQYL